MSGYTWADLTYAGGGRLPRVHVVTGSWRAHPQYLREGKALCGLRPASGECWVTWDHRPVSFPACQRCERSLARREVLSA